MNQMKFEPGTKVGLWTILSFSHMESSKRYWVCRCACGTERPVAQHALRGGRSNHCGCGTAEALKAAATIHGHASNGTLSLTYTSWRCMIGRCIHASTPSYAKYGGAGITVCREWLDSFPAFLKDMGERPTSKHTIHRRDNSKGYNMDNCTWATKREQQNGRGCTVFLTHDGRTLPIADWARDVGISASLIWKRIRRGLSSREVLSKTRVNGMTGKWKR